MKLHVTKGAIFLFALVVFIGSCNMDSAKTDEGPHGLILSNMDTTISPKNDFYNYVNGTWLKETQIPDDRSIWGGFSVLRKSTDKDVLDILARAKELEKYTDETDQAKAMAIFDGQLDTLRRNEMGLDPLTPALDDISNISSLEELQAVFALNPAVDAPFLGIGGLGDLNNSSMNAAYIFTGNLGLPNREFYTDQDDKSKEIREEYKNHISRMLQYLGDNADVAEATAEKILSLESALAEPRLDKIESRDVRNYNNPRSIDDIQAMLPSIDVRKFLSDVNVPETVDTIIVTEPRYMEFLNRFMNETPIEDLKALMRWSTLNTNASLLTTELDKTNWEFYNKYLNGAKEQRPADERALATVNNTLGEALGKLYVDEKFPPEAKEKAELMIANVIDAFKERIRKLDWMTQPTKEKAIEKLDKFTVKIGYPDEWEDYSAMEVNKDKSYFDNMMAVNKWSFAKNISEIGQPVDRKEWGMSPQTVNAYFNPLNNEIVFPAAILQPPFYDYLADEAVNYGGIGAVIGHEISHAFDDSGSRFDADGNLSNWWTDEDLEEFTKRGNALAEQYSNIEVMDSVFINGKFTLGENIGDLGGVLGAYDGLQRFFAENGRPDDIDGFTAEQRFFMSWATIWRTLSREDALRNQVKTDTHSPGRWRATQPLLNIDAFYEAFDITEGDEMYIAPEDRVRIW